MFSALASGAIAQGNIKTVHQLFLNKRHVEVYELEKISGFSYGSTDNKLHDHLHMSQRTTKPKISLVRLIKVFADRMCLLQLPGHPKRDEREPLPYWVDVQADLSLCWLHRSYCRFCHALSQYVKGKVNMGVHNAHS